MLARLVSKSWPQVIHPSRPPKELGLQEGATAPSLGLNFLASAAGDPLRSRSRYTNIIMEIMGSSYLLRSSYVAGTELTGLQALSFYSHSLSELSSLDFYF